MEGWVCCEDRNCLSGSRSCSVAVFVSGVESSCSAAAELQAVAPVFEAFMQLFRFDILVLLTTTEVI
jgi:hypothetical protein